MFTPIRSSLVGNDGIDCILSGTNEKMQNKAEQIWYAFQLSAKAKQMDWITNTLIVTQTKAQLREIVSNCNGPDRLRGPVCVGFDPGGVSNTTIRGLMQILPEILATTVVKQVVVTRCIYIENTDLFGTHLMDEVHPNIYNDGQINRKTCIVRTLMSFSRHIAVSICVGDICQQIVSKGD